MSENETDTEVDAPEVPVQQLNQEDERNESLFQNLRDKREETAKSKTLMLTIPGYEGEPPILMAKYRLMTGKELEAIAQKAQRETKDTSERQLIAAVDTFIQCCAGMYVDIGNGAPQPMTLGGTPIEGYDERLSEAMQLKTETARQVVFAVFGDNDIAILAHNARLSLWMSNTSRKVDDDFLGLS